MLCEAKNDRLILEISLNPNYRVNEKVGILETLVQRNGKVGKTWRMAGYRHHSGYWFLKYQGKKLPIHRIMWALCRGFIESHKVVNHMDGNRGNNKIANLELVTRSENELHAFRYLGKKTHHHNKVSWKKIRQIRSDWDEGVGRFTIKRLAEKYKMPRETVRRIALGLTYKEEGGRGAN